MSTTISSVWLITREYAGFAEAGGVKNVACSLAEGLYRQGIAVTAFLPRYGFIRDFGVFLFSTDVLVDQKSFQLSFYELYNNGVRLLFIDSIIFSQKKGVYTYTVEDELEDPVCIRGQGHRDVHLMNILFQKSIIKYAEITLSVPSIVHCQDAHTAVLPALITTNSKLSPLFARVGFVVTIHNAGPGYRQVFSDFDEAQKLTGLPPSVLNSAMHRGCVEPFLLASMYSALTTVSPWYADELTSQKGDHFSEGLSCVFRDRKIPIIGITNALDYDKYDPADTTVSCLPYAYNPLGMDFSGKYRCRDVFLSLVANPSEYENVRFFGSMIDDPHAVYFAYHGRIAAQKGIDTLVSSAYKVLRDMSEARFIILGQGQKDLEESLIEMTKEFPGRCVYIQGYEKSLARLSVAVSDFLVLPSLFEPCGLEDLIALMYGTLPIAHAVGGLQKIMDGVTGFLYYSGDGILDSTVLCDTMKNAARPIIRSNGRGAVAVREYVVMIFAGTETVCSQYNWDSCIHEQYLPLYEKFSKL